MSIFVIAPNHRQFCEFERQERKRLFESGTTEYPVYHYVSRPEMLRGYDGELIIVNADQIDRDDLLRHAEYHNDKRCPIKYVDL